MENNKKAIPNPERSAKSAPEIALFCVFIGFVALFSLLILFLPKHEGELSPNERRILAAAPDARFNNILSGGFSKQVDTWLQDHFPMRNFFVAVYAYTNRLTGRNAVENVSLAKGSWLINAPIEENDDAIDVSITKLRNFIDRNELDAYACIIPTAGYMLENTLNKPHLEYRDSEILSRIGSALSTRMKSISVEKLFNDTGDVASLYYRTDHHLTMRGSYEIYRALGKELGFEPLDESEFTKTKYDFFGTSYGKSGLFLTPADTLETWVGAYDGELSVTTVDGAVETEHTGSLDTAQLKEDIVDKYAAYLYSNHGITRIENENAEGGVLLVLKDSYGNAIVPFLAAHYRTIIMIDTRSMYYSYSMPAPSELCEEYGINDFVVLMGLDTVADGSLDMLR